MTDKQCFDKELYHERYNALNIASAAIITSILDFGSLVYEGTYHYVSGVLKFNSVYLTTIDPVEFLQCQLHNENRIKFAHEIKNIKLDLIDPQTIPPPFFFFFSNIHFKKLGII